MIHWGKLSIDRAARLLAAALITLATLLPAAVTPALAADDRSLYLYYTHTNETARITFKRNGRYLQEGLQQLNVFLRDWRRNEPASMDPALFDLLWEVYRQAGSSQPMHIVSAYRAPATNAMLRASSSGVAENSQHTRGRAIDFYIPGVSIATLREIGMRLQVGGVGYYPTSNSPFVHLDTGSVRAWPRMTTAQLRNLFPDGRTLHLGADGTVLSQQGRQVAQAEWERCQRVPCSAGAALGGEVQVASSGGRGRTLMDIFFGGGDDEELDIAEAAAAPQPAPQPAPAPVAAQPAIQVASAAPTPQASRASQAPITAPTPPQRPATIVALAAAQDSAPETIPFQVRTDAPAEISVAQAAAPVPPVRPAGLTLVAAAAPAPSADPDRAATETAAQAIAALDGPPPQRPDFEGAAILAAYAPAGGPGAGIEAQSVDTGAVTAALPRQVASLPPTAPQPMPAPLGDLREAGSDPAAGLEAFAALFDGPIVHAGGPSTGPANPADPAIANAMASLGVAPGALFAPATGAAGMLMASAPISGPGFGALMAADQPSATADRVAAGPDAYAGLPRFGGNQTIWVRLE